MAACLFWAFIKAHANHRRVLRFAWEAVNFDTFKCILQGMDGGRFGAGVERTLSPQGKRKKPKARTNPEFGIRNPNLCRPLSRLVLGQVTPEATVCSGLEA